jgi:hypothetical protein
MVNKIDVKMMEDKLRILCEHAGKMCELAKLNLELSNKMVDLFAGYKL